MEYYGYPDCDVFNEVVEGVGLSGPAPYVPSFEASFKPAKVTESELASSARAGRISLLSSIRSSGDPFIDSEVYAKTLEELDCGWIEGPLDPSSLPDDAVINRRFGIKQTSGDRVKVRLIDDFSASGVNGTVQIDSSTKLHTLDIAAALCMDLLKKSPTSQWVGKTVDLSAAYRQLRISPKSRWVSYIAVFDPSTRRPKVFAMKALPFGASRSVYGFLRVAHSLWWLGCKMLRLLWSNFFDDFITLARVEESESIGIAVSQYFRLLGWAVSDGEKDLPFSACFKALGVEVNLSCWLDGLVKFANTEKRVSELSQTISCILKEGRLSKQAALALRGRMQFAHAQLWGRASKLCLNAVTAHAYSDGSDSVSDNLAHFLSVFLGHLASAKPREVTAQWGDAFFMFTDASFNPEDTAWPCGLGGVLVSADGTQLSAFSLCLDLGDLNCLGYPAKSTVIFEAELLALILGLKLWRKHLKSRPCVFYVDNNATRDVSIAGRARTEPGSSLVAKLLSLEDTIGTNAWFARVPSSSNIADPPSRGSLDGSVAKTLPVDLLKISVKKILREVACAAKGGGGDESSNM